MKVMNTLIICLTVLLIIGGLIFAVWSENVYETPYEQCLEVCWYADGTSCAEQCNADFIEAIEVIADRFVPILEEIIKQEFASSEKAE